MDQSASRLFGQHHGQAGLHALAKFQAVDRDRHYTITTDLHESRGLLSGLERADSNLLIAPRLGRCSGGEYAQRKTRGRRQLEKLAPLKLRASIQRVSCERAQAFGQICKNAEE